VDARSVQDWSGELRIRAYSGAEQGDNTFFLQKDDYVQLSIIILGGI
jgi:hypothetical protein